MTVVSELASSEADNDINLIDGGVRRCSVANMSVASLNWTRRIYDRCNY